MPPHFERSSHALSPLRTALRAAGRAPAERARLLQADDLQVALGEINAQMAEIQRTLRRSIGSGGSVLQNTTQEEGVPRP